MCLYPLTLGTGLYPTDNRRVCAVRTQFPGALLGFDFVLRFIWLTIVPNCSSRLRMKYWLQLHGLPTAVHMRPQYKKTTPVAVQSVNEIRSRFLANLRKNDDPMKTLAGTPLTPSQYWPLSRAFAYTSHFLREKALGSRLTIYRTHNRFLQGQCSLSPNWLSHVFSVVTRRGESVLSGS